VASRYGRSFAGCCAVGVWVLRIGSVDPLGAQNIGDFEKVTPLLMANK